MNLLLRYLTITIIGIAAVSFLLSGPVVTQRDNAKPADELDYPVLLVHGLGESPGEAAFGKLKEYLEDFYFDVYVMDFNKYAKNPLAQNKKKGSLGVQAAILGMEIRDVLKKANTERLHIVAHSYGGLIVQAYLLDMGREYAKRKGFYNNNVQMVCYIQTPFYGATGDEDILDALLDDTDYGPYFDKKEMKRTLTMGSKDIFNMDDLLRTKNIYRPQLDEPYIQAVTFLSRDDKVLDERYGNLNTFMKKGEVYTFNRYSIFDGRFGHFSHSTHPVSAVDKLNSLAYVEKIDDTNFLAIASFLDHGRNWRKIGFKNLPNEAMAMVKYEKKKGHKTLNGDEVTLTLKKKFKEEESSASPSNKKGEVLNGTYNSDSRVFVFTGLTPGEYNIKIKNSSKEDYEQVIELGFTDLKNFTYDPAENKLLEGGQVYRKPDEGIFFKDRIEYTAPPDAENWSAKFSGLNTDGFYIEFDVENINMNLYDKGCIFSLYNASGRQDDWRWNGSRLEFIARGYNYKNGPGCITIHFMVDKNRDGAYHREQGGLEAIEAKSLKLFNWFDKHHVKIRVMTTDTGGTRMDVWMDNELINAWRPEAEITKSAPYYNPDPLVSFGSRYHSDKYKNPTGAIVTNFVIYNIEK